MKPGYLIVNADDYGLTGGVSRGIREAHLSGIVTSTTAIMNAPGVEAELGEAIRTCPLLGLGVHLTLTAGAPVLPAAQVPSLVNASGWFFKQMEFRARLASLDAGEAKAEWHAQVERFCHATGRAPDHLDSHHHSSYWSPTLFTAMLELASEYGCPIRAVVTHNPDEDSDGGMSDAERETVNLGLRARTAQAIRYPDHLLTAFYDETATLEILLSLLQGLKEGVTEIMSHPGYSDDLLMSVSSYNRLRDRERLILTDETVKGTIKALGIELINFGKL